jgi:hypothetical protein
MDAMSSLWWKDERWTIHTEHFASSSYLKAEVVQVGCGGI